MRLDGSAIVFTAEGVTFVEELRKGMHAWGIHQGSPHLVKIAETSVVRPDSGQGLWVYGKAADLIAGPETLIATSGGLKSMSQLFSGRESGYGYMSGTWPKAELFHFLSGARTDIEGLLKRLIAGASVGSNPAVYRVGAHASSKLRKLGRVFFEDRVGISNGPAGWNWLGGTLRKIPIAEGFQPQDALLFWNVGTDDPVYWLPIMEKKLRYLTLACLISHRVGFQVDLRPRYSPSEARVSLVSENRSHSEISGVLSEVTSRLHEITLSAKGDYLCVNGLLCA